MFLGWIMAILMICFGSFAVNYQSDVHNDTATQAQDLSDENIASSMVQYRGFIVSYINGAQYLLDYPGRSANSSIPDNKISIPSWFNKNSQVLNYVVGKKVYIYCVCANNAEAVSEILAEGNTSSALSGVKLSATTYHSPAYTTPISGEIFPAAIPDGSVVYIAHE